MKHIPLLTLLGLAISMAPSAHTQEHAYRPPQGFVPDEKTAIAIAVAVWTPIYGEERIASEKPYTASLADGRWTVIGALPEGWIGGVAEAVIAKEDGRILRVTHGK